MKSGSLFFILCSLFIILPGESKAGDQGQLPGDLSGDLSVESIFAFNGDQNEPVDRGKHHKIGPAQSQPAERVDSPAKAFLSMGEIPFYVQPFFSVADPLATDFTNGVYHRFRPRDPTSR